MATCFSLIIDWMYFGFLTLLSLLLSGSFSISYSEVNEGKKLYINHCSACHSLEATGKGIFPSLTEVADMLGKEGLFTIIKKGREETGMPPISGLSDLDLEDIYSYLKTLKKAEKLKAEGGGQRAEKTEKEDVPAEKNSPKEDRKVLTVNSLREMGIPLTERAIKAYQSASRLPDLFSELPCFCGCQFLNHSSLHDCYRTTHGAKCALCQEEAEVAERLHTAYQLNKLITSPETSKTLGEAERLRKEETDLNKRIGLQLVKLFWKNRAIGGLHQF